MKNAPSRFGWAALIAAWAVDLLFWQKQPGLSIVLWVAIVLVIGLLVARSLKVRPAAPSLVLIALALLFAAMTFIRRESFTLFISMILCFFSMALLAATFQTGNWLYYKIGDYIKGGLQFCLALLIRPADLVIGKPLPAAVPAVDGPSPEDNPDLHAPILAAGGPGWKTSARQQALPVIRGLVLALPVVLVLGSLLAAADPVFNTWTRDLLRIFDLSKLPEYLFRLFYIMILAFILTGTYLHAIQPGTLEPRPRVEARWFPPFLGWTEGVVILGAVNLLFFIFVSIQFWYLFGGQANISTTGFTYSEYARRGFNELVMVALLSLALYLGLGAVTRLENSLQQKVWGIFNVMLMALVLVILVSSFSRLLMYEDAYGFTQLRTYTNILILWLAGLLFVTIGLEISKQRHRFALVALVVAFGFGLTFGFLNVDGFIAHQNIQRALTSVRSDNSSSRSSQLDGDYLTTLSDDVVPVLLEEFQRPNQPEAVKDILGAELSCREALISLPKEAPSWLSYNFSQANARILLQTNHSLWQAYPVTKQNRESLVVKLKSGTHNCQSSTWLD